MATWIAGFSEEVEVEADTEDEAISKAEFEVSYHGDLQYIYKSEEEEEEQ